MRRIKFVVYILVILLLIYSCANKNSKLEGIAGSTNSIVHQKADGTIDLNIEKATCYNDNANPSCNTAEWSVVVSKPGRYKVWLSSATIDTMDLQYNSSVKISLMDERLDVQPVGDKIVLDANDVKLPYYRADSYMGTFYIQDPGEYSIQVISEKVKAKKANSQSVPDSDHTKLISVFLTPMTR